MKWRRQPEGNTNLLTTEAQLGSGNNSYINLPSLEAPSSMAPSTDANAASPQGSLFETASLFETNAVNADVAGLLDSDEKNDLLALAAVPAHSRTSSSGSGEAAGDSEEAARACSSEVRGIKGGPVSSESIRGGKRAAEELSTSTEVPVTAELIGTADAAAAADTATLSAANAVAAECTTELDALFGCSSADDLGIGPDEERGQLLEILGQDSCVSATTQDGSQHSRASFLRFFKIGGPAKLISGRAAGIAMSDIIILPKLTESISESFSTHHTSRDWCKCGRNAWEAHERPAKSTQDMKALRHQVKLTMFVVSLIQIVSKDSLDFCAAFEALIYADMTPSWSRE